MATEKAWYVSRYYGHLTTKQEHLAHRDLVGTGKAMQGPDGCCFADRGPKERKSRFPRLAFWNFHNGNTDILNLTHFKLAGHCGRP